jgi:amidase
MLHTLTALEQADLIRRRELSSEALTRHYLERIAAHDAALGAFVDLRPEAALAAARRRDLLLRRFPNAARGRLFGLPTGMKDLHFTRGFFARMGARPLRWLWSPLDDVTSAGIRRAGLVIVGKLSTSELGILPVVETDNHPPTRNPWDTSLSAGGSSGGSAAAISAGLLPLAAASDGAGSVRIPAAFCGLVGLKPSRGLVPNPHARIDRIGISVIGPHARDVDDAAALLDVLTGLDGRAAGFLARARIAPPGGRVAYSTRYPLASGSPVDPIIAAAVRSVAATLEDLGHRVSEGPELSGDIDEFLPIYKHALANTFVPFASGLQPVSRWLREEGLKVSLEDAIGYRDRLTARTETWFQGVDLWLLPTVSTLPHPVGAWRHLDGRDTMYAAAPLGAFTAVFNASGQPAINIPVWVDSVHLPIGVQLVGRVGDDAKLLAIARQVMEARGTLRGKLARDA